MPRTSLSNASRAARGAGRRADDLLVAALPAAVYLRTLAPSVTTGDSGELVTAAATLSIAHPTGYPLYLLLGHLWVRLFFFLTPAVAMNLFSAAAAVAACVALRRLAERVAGDRASAAAAALLLAFSLSFWSQATAARVYALGALLVALALLELARLREGGGSLARAWLWFGLGMANHTVMVVLAPFLVAATLRSPLGWRARAEAAYWAVPGLGLYLYIPLAASLDPVQNWGDPTNLERFVAYLSRRNYWPQRYVEGVADLARVGAHYLGAIPRELTWPGAVAVLLGVATGWRARRWALGLGLYLLLANVALMAWHGSRHDIFHWGRYLITGWLGLALMAALGFAALRRALASRPALGLALVALAPAAALALHFPRSDRSADTWARDFAQRMLSRLEPGAVLLARDDNIAFPLIYLRHVEALRTDVQLALEGLSHLAAHGIDPSTAPVYTAHHFDPGPAGLALAPSGLAFRVLPHGAALAPPDWEAVALPAFEAVEAPGQRRYLDRILIGHYFLMKAVNLERVDPVAARAAIERTRAISFDNDANQVNAGIFLERNLQLEAALEAFEAARAINPRLPLAGQRIAFLRPLLAQLGAAASAEARATVLANLLAASGRDDLEELALRQGLEAQPASFALRHRLARRLAARGDYAAAREQLLAALELRPDSAAAQRDLASVRRALSEP